MKLYKLFAYATAGIITGLLIENYTLQCRAECAKKNHDKKKRLEKKALETIAGDLN